MGAYLDNKALGSLVGGISEFSGVSRKRICVVRMRSNFDVVGHFL